MRFDRSTTPQTKWPRREIFRIARLIGLLLLVLAAMYWAAQPEHWHWLVPPQQPAVEKDAFGVEGISEPLE